MDVKDLRTEVAAGDRNNDGNTKYPQDGGALPCHRNKAYQDIGSNSLGKVDAATTRPCAVIGPDRVVPPPASTDAYLKKGLTEPWLGPDNTYRRPPEYPHKLLDYQHPTRNISPRQTFQENMQRIMVPPTYSSVKMKEDHNFSGDPNITQMRNNKLNVPTDPNSKYCDVPYNINPLLNEQKTVRSSDISASNMNSVLMRSAPHVWPPTSANVRPSKPYPQDLCQYPEYPSCAGPRPMVMPRTHRTVHEEPGPVYSDPYYHDGNIRYKPYPSVKERYPQARYEYIGNYPNPFHPPPPFPTHKYDLQKPMAPHAYPGYSQMPIKYLDSRMADPLMNGYQRSLNQQANYNNMAYRNQMIHPPYGPVPSNCLQTNKFYPYPPDASKSMPSNKLPYADANAKIYSEYENSRPKNFPMSEGFYVNDITRTHHMKATGLPSGYLPNIHSMPTHPYYRKEPMKGYEYNPHFRNIDPSMNINGNPVPRFTTQFSPNSVAISPSDSSASNDTNQTQGTSHEDFGYVSQSSTTSVRSLDSALNRIPYEYRRYEHRYSPIVKPSLNKIDHNSNGSKDKKEIDVRQFLQMWNEGEEEGGDVAKEVMIKTVPNNIIDNANSNNFETSSQEQLYVLGLVNVPSEELAKYEHIQKVSKLPENIKGYNNIELLHQFEEVIESSNLNNYTAKHPISKDFHTSYKGTMPMHGISIPSRPLSPLDVEAKISQSVIHKDVGCNFEIKPCSPKMLNVEIAAPVQLVINERIIEKVSNPIIDQSPSMHSQKDNRDDYNIVKCQDRISTHDNSKIASCKLINSQYSHNDTLDPTKTNYSIQDLESNSGVCLASLPRLDNDIELSFPEVNQQFINANKVDSVITPTPMKDLPPLDLEQCDTTSQQSTNDVNNTTSAKLTENDFSKLSKYRKLKRKSSEQTTSETSVQALRTDSVIIKNPENNKSLDKNLENTKISSTKIQCNETQEDPINLSVSTESRQKSSLLSEVKKNNLSCSKELDIAIDFSTNTNENKEIHDVDPKGRNTKDKEQYEQQKIFLAAEDGKLLSEKSNLFSDDDSIRSILEGENNTAKMIDEVNKSSTLPNSKIPSNTKKKKKRSSSIKNNHSQIMSEDYTPKPFDESQMQQAQFSGYSTPDAEDSINVKMRELFGELSGAETEPISIGPRDYQDDSGLATITSDDDMLSTKMFALHEGVLKDQSEQVQNPIKIGQDNKNQDKATPDMSDPKKILSTPNSLHDIAETKHKRTIFDINDKPIETLTKNVIESIETQKQLDSPSCLTNAENFITTNCNSVADTFRISKELLSPWIQKLMIHTEGCVNVTEHNLVNDDNLKCLLPRPSYLEENMVSDTLIDNLSPTIMYNTETKLTEMESENEMEEIKECPILKEKSVQKNNCYEEKQDIDLKISSIADPKHNSREDSESFVTLDDNKKLDSPLFETCLSSVDEESSLQPAKAPASQVIETICKPEDDVLTSEVIITATTENRIPMNACEDIASSPKAETYDGFRNCKEISNDLKTQNSICNTTEDENHSETNYEELLPNSQSNLNSGSNKTNLNSEDDLDESNLTYSLSAGTVSSSNLKDIEICECDNSIDGDTLKNLEVPTEMVTNQTGFMTNSVGTVAQDNDTMPYSNRRATKNYSLFETTKLKSIISENELVQIKAVIPCEDSNNKHIVENETRNINDLQNSTNLDENGDQDEISNNRVQTEVGSQGADSCHPDIEKTDIFNEESKTPTVTVSPHIIESNDHNDSLRNSFLSPSSEVIIEEYNNKDDSVSDINIEDSGIIVDCSHNVFESIQKESLCPEIANFTTPSRAKDLIENCQQPQNYSTKKRQTLKRSLSDTALDEIRENEPENHTFLRPNKIKKAVLNNKHETRLFAENICEVLQNHRRNSVSSMQNEENVSFCILIDNNCIITEECDESDKICFSEVPEDCIACVQEESSNEVDSIGEIIQFQEDIDCCDCPSVLDNNFEQEVERSTEPWLEDVACVETVVSEDIAENIVISASVSPRNFGSEGECEDVENETEAYVTNHSDNDEQISDVDAHYVDPLYPKIQMNSDKTLNTTESHIIHDFSERYDSVSLQEILLGSTIPEEVARNSLGFECTSPMSMSSPSTPGNSPSHRESIELANYGDCATESAALRNNNTGSTFTEVYDEKDDAEILYSARKVNTITSCESSIDDVFSSKKSEDNSKCAISSSPEVSSTTSEEKSTGILLKLTNYSGSRVPQVTDISPINSICCKYTEKKDYLSSNGKQYLNPNLSTRTLITKAAQKYIPPLKETIPDLKVKLPLPPQSLIKLKQMKLSKEMVKINEDKTVALKTFKQEGKKPKQKFEDVLKSIDEIQYQKHKEKSKKVRKSIPKVVIKKNENGSHYASTSFKDNHNPDLTGRKWQPWVFLERNNFIDKMALKKKTRAIFNHRKNCYVLAEKFYKYRSVSSTKFVISQPNLDESSSGLKYTIRLKHQY